MRRAVVAVGCAVILAAWTVGARAQGIDYAAINAAVTADHIRAGYATFVTKAQDLQSATKRFCGKPSEASLAAVKDTYHLAADAWQAVEHLRFGPAEATSAHARLNFWPDKRGRVGKHLKRLMARDDLQTALKADAFAAGSVAVQGFPALERLLFVDDPVAALKPSQAGSTPCWAMEAITANISNIAKNLSVAWQRDLMAEKPAKDGTGALFNSLASGLQAAMDLKLGGPLGSKSGRVRAKRAEHWRAGRAVRNIELNLRSLQALYLALAQGAGSALLDTPHDELIREMFSRTIRDATDLGPSFRTAASTENGVLRLKVLAADISDLRELIIEHVAEALDLVLGFNSFDGD